MSNKPEIIIGELPETVADAIDALARLDVFQRAGRLQHVVHEPRTDEGGVIRPDGTPRIRDLPSACLREQLHVAADWKVWKQGKGKDAEPILVSCGIPRDVLAAVHERGEWPSVRPLRGVVTWPTLRPDGTVLSEAGYDHATALIVAPTVQVHVADEPTLESAKHALEYLVDLISGFPFAGPAHASAWIGALLTLVARPAIEGPTPQTLIDANAQGTGKTKLADLIGVIVLGREPAKWSAPQEESEWAKTLTAIALAADPYVIIDNVTRTVRSAAYDKVLTSGRYGDRILGKSEHIDVEMRTCFALTANNASLSTDQVRRSIHVRLECREEHPEQRTGFKHPDIIAHARRDRSNLLSAALTILRAYVVAGRPHVKMATMGSYESWSSVVRASLIWAGAPDPAETQAGLQETSDTDRDVLEDLLRAWHRKFGSRWVSSSEVFREVTQEHHAAADLREAVQGLCGGSGRPLTVRSLGNALRAKRSRIAGGLVLEAGTKGEHGVPWRVSDTRPADSLTPLTLIPIPTREKTKVINMHRGQEHSQDSHRVRMEPGDGVAE
jgi:hypothetical protein